MIGNDFILTMAAMGPTPIAGLRKSTLKDPRKSVQWTNKIKPTEDTEIQKAVKVKVNQNYNKTLNIKYWRLF